MLRIPANLPELKLAHAVDLFSRIGRWWLSEFLAMFPPRYAAWLTGRDRKALVLSLESERISLRLQADGGHVLASGQVDRAAYSSALIDKFLATQRLRRADVDIGVRLTSDQYFDRCFFIPLEASRSIDKVATQDLTRRTPFRLGDIYHDFTASRSGRKMLVRQWVARRAVADEVMAALELRPETVSFLDAAPAYPQGSLPYIRVMQDRTTRRSRVGSAGFALIFVAAVLAATSTALRLWQQQALLDEVTDQLVRIKPKAQQVRAVVDKLERTQARIYRVHTYRRETVRLLDAWDEATRVLPDHTWLTELRLTEIRDKQLQQVVFSGYSAAAANLVALVDDSPLFFDASLVSPIARDNAEGRERFSMQAKLRPGHRNTDAP